MWPFRSGMRGSSAVLIDITSSGVGGAYAQYAKGNAPSILYTVRVPIEKRGQESIQDAMLRALDLVGQDLIERGAACLRREVGSAHVDCVLISVSAPWQETKVRTESIHPGKPFTFTKHLLAETIASNEHLAADRMSFGESVIATILNGYDIPDPFGKKAQRAEVVILSSTLDKAVVESIRARVRKLYHTHTISFTAFAPVAYSVLRDLYPHERDFLVLDVSNVSTELAFVKGGLLVDVGTMPKGISSLLDATRAAERMTVEEETATAHPTAIQPGYVNPDRNARFSIRAQEAREAWLTGISGLFKGFAQLHALPRTLFLLTEPEARDYLRRALDSDVLHALWLSDEPLTVITVAPEQFASHVKARGLAEHDVFLSILALYQAKRG